MNGARKDVLRAVDDAARKQAQSLLGAARFGALATLDPRDGRPVATRVGVATDADGTPVIFVSALAAHTAALRADRRCSLLLGEAGKGDALAHPRITLACDARELARGSGDWQRIEARYLEHLPKAKLYSALPDFTYFRLEVASASLNAGFGKAYALTRDDILA